MTSAKGMIVKQTVIASTIYIYFKGEIVLWCIRN